MIEHHRIFKSVHHRLDLGPNMLPGAQQYTTVESAAALKIQDKIEGKYNENMQSTNGQYRNEIYKRAESMIPQLDGTFNVSDNSDSDSHSYLDLAGINIIPYRTRGQKQRHDENERANVSSALKDNTKPNTKANIQRQKVPDDEDIDIDKIVKGDKPKDDRKSATKIDKQSKEKEAKRLALEKAKRIQIQKDIKDKEANRLALEKAQIEIEALIEKHRPPTPKTPDKVNTSGTGKNADIDGREGTEKVKPPHKKATKDRLNHPTRRMKKPIKAIRIHCWVIRWLVLQHV